jgi:uncharacterized protein YndB with AHSA1/START domain
MREIDEQTEVTFVRSFAKPPEEVWHALTDPAVLREWFPQRISGRLTVPGARLTFTDDPNVPDATFTGKVLAVREPLLLVFSWGGDTLRFELSHASDICSLTFTHSFADHGKAARDAAGWHVCLQALAAAFDSTVRPAPEHATLMHEYEERFGLPHTSKDPHTGREPVETRNHFDRRWRNRELGSATVH